MQQLPSYTPVRLRDREDGWTPARQWEFLQVLGDTASVAEAARRVGMSERSAHRLRRHPEAEAFRAAWDAALVRVWQRVEQVALDRVVNGDVEVIERDGVVVATRRRPCSDRLMIHMLQEQVRRMTAQAADLAAANAAAVAAARHPQLVDGKLHHPAPPPPIAPATQETEALRAFHNRVQALPDSTGWDVEAQDLAGAVPALPMPDRWLAPADGRIGVKLRSARLRGEGMTSMGDATVPRKVMKTPLGGDFSAELAADDTDSPWPARRAARGKDPRVRQFGG